VAKRSREAGDTVSLFPFLSILTCVIGTLMLMITAIAMARMSRPLPGGPDEVTDPEVLRAMAINEFNEELASLGDEAGRIEVRIAELELQARAAEKELAAAKAEFERLQQQREQLSEAEKKSRTDRVRYTRYTAAAQQSAERIKQLEAELAKLQPAVEQLREKLKKEGKLPEEQEIKIQPSGSGVDLRPSFVECGGSGVVLHEGPEPRRLKLAELATDQQWATLLERVKAVPSGVLIFLVRSDGIPTYLAVQRIAQQAYVRNGKLPVVGQGKIDVSHFRGPGD
jgi:multidrug efflux pump subunit AcrA (membrane-fusion protein)